MQRLGRSDVAQGESRGWRRRRPTGMAGGVFWLAVLFGLVWLLRQVPAAQGSGLGWMQLVVGAGLIGLAVPLLWRMVHKHLLWSLRNKLILTYLLIGLAPVALVVTFVTISAYIAAGQFSIHLADTRMHQELDALGQGDVLSMSRVMGRLMRDRNEGGARPGTAGGGPPDIRPPEARDGNRSTAPAAAAAPASKPTTTSETTATVSAEALPDPLRAKLHSHSEVYLNGVQQPNFLGFGPRPDGSSAAEKTPLGLPAWATDLHGREFRGLVSDGDDLYLVAIDQRQLRDGVGLVTAITSLPVDSALLDVVAKGLGRVTLAGLGDAVGKTRQNGSRAGEEGQTMRARLSELQGVSGGAEPMSVNLCDFRVLFLSTLDTVDWDTGEAARIPATIQVHSRPSLLYRQLFGSTLGGIVTSYIRSGLIALCILFVLIEALALWAAMRLSRSITAAVEELYAATQRVDRGDLVHRISAAQTVQHDQLGELARSFNRMTGSLERLLLEQYEKERLQSELTIAQEVQANLFPHHVRSLPGLELHGACRPARSVSGDYYDFLAFHHPDNPDGSRGREAGVGIALGDISGKGISAALLMATLHSAVRAYQLAGEDLVYSDSTFAGLIASREGRAGDGGKLFESPGRILSMLNRHLYRSTQPEKYATLFLAHYDADRAQLTYSNAGHLPPFVLGRDGTVRRLDCGGTVVGLIDGMRYEEGHVAMESGDILIAYSDGITEPENDFGEFGEARLLEVVQRYRDQPLHVISAQVMQALDAWIGAEEQPDDITLVLARQL
jgi:sigma-B regulation protein RsbU (phosphoserine phosphatase)